MSKARFTIYDKRDGRIVEKVSCKAGDEGATFAGMVNRNYVHFGRIDGHPESMRDQFVDLETLEFRDKTAFPITVSENRIEGLPEHTEVTFLFDRSTARMDSSGVLEIEAGTPGTVQVQLRHGAYFTIRSLDVPCG